MASLATWKAQHFQAEMQLHTSGNLALSGACMALCRTESEHVLSSSSLDAARFSAMHQADRRCAGARASVEREYRLLACVSMPECPEYRRGTPLQTHRRPLGELFPDDAWGERARATPPFLFIGRLLTTDRARRSERFCGSIPGSVSVSLGVVLPNRWSLAL